MFSDTNNKVTKTKQSIKSYYAILNNQKGYSMYYKKQMHVCVVKKYRHVGVISIKIVAQQKL